MFDAWDVALNGFLIPLLSDYWDLSVGQAAWIATANLIGMALGAFVWGGIADVIGRKKAFTLTLLVFSIFTVAGAFAPAYGWFILFRLLAGFGLGGCIPVDYALVGEFTPSRHRGRVLTAMDGWWPIGASLCAFVSAYLLEFGDWRLIMLVMIIPALLTVAVRFGIPESPLYLASVGRFEEADAVIARLVERTGAEVREWTHDEPAVVPKTGPETSPETVRAASGPSVGRQLRAASGQLVQLWQHSARITLVSWSLFVSILLVYYAALTWLPGILKKQGLEDQAAFLVTGSMTAVGILGVIVAFAAQMSSTSEASMNTAAPTSSTADRIDEAPRTNLRPNRSTMTAATITPRMPTAVIEPVTRNAAWSASPCFLRIPGSHVSAA